MAGKAELVAVFELQFAACRKQPGTLELNAKGKSLEKMERPNPFRAATKHLPTQSQLLDLLQQDKSPCGMNM